MQRFLEILTQAQMETSLERLRDAEVAHQELTKDEQEQSTFLLAEIAKVEAEGDLSDYSTARFYLDQLKYDLGRIAVNQERREEMLVGRRKTIELFMKWDQVRAA